MGTKLLVKNMKEEKEDVYYLHVVTRSGREMGNIVNMTTPDHLDQFLKFEFKSGNDVHIAKSEVIEIWRKKFIPRKKEGE